MAFRHIALLFDFVFIYETYIFCSFINFFYELINTLLSQKAAQDALLFGCSGWSGSSSFCCPWWLYSGRGSASSCTWKDKNICSAVVKIKVFTVQLQVRKIFWIKSYQALPQTPQLAKNNHQGQQKLLLPLQFLFVFRKNWKHKDFILKLSDLCVEILVWE